MGGGPEWNDLSTSALRGGPAMKTPGNWNFWYNLSTDNRKRFQFGGGGSNNWGNDDNFRRTSVRGWVRFRPKDAMSIFIHPFYTFRRSNLQYMDTINQNNEDRFIFGQINQKTMGIVMRLDFSITPDLSIQYYGQPFVSAGKYSAIKRITNPRADRYEDRFHIFTDAEIKRDADGGFSIDENGDGNVVYSLGNPDFNFRQFRSNLIVRWEYNPGSTIFLVWTQERTSFAEDGNFSFRNDLDNLFQEDATNVVLLKVSRWFSL